ncbi:MAG: ergothioneine biosynthesis protein EgtC [Proteobacteria bacterium]|nr:ergothioneine biosynthesis protein EgtC [Pseudomonadota bacterium]NOG61604.1 ergothioneine biosynthesis protein EgtC [Pseudomonadota bacterium]
MCRLAAYLGSEISLSQFLLEPEHSLVKQAWAPQEMQEGTLNADGYGVAWLANDNRPCTYKNVLPIWSDTNLDGLGRSLKSGLWLANVRSATPGQGISEANTQPFEQDNLIFTHNGFLKPFDKNIKAALLDILSNEIRAEINGNSDSLYLYALLQQQLLKQNSVPDAIIKMMDKLKSVCTDQVTALLNLVISDGEYLYACRHTLNGNCPSLYYSLNDDNVKIASEPLTSNDEWTAFPENTLISFNHSSVINQTSL